MLRPTFVCDNVYKIDYAFFKKNGVSNIIFDIDNTLISYDVSLPDEKLRSLIDGLKNDGFNLFILSNGHSERAERFSDSLGIVFKSDAFKPSQKGYKELAREYGLLPENTVMIGDQLFTDISGASIFGCKSVLVVPIDTSNEPGFVKIKRIFEKPILKKIYKNTTRMED